MSTQHFCHYLKDRNDKRFRNTQKIRAMLEFRSEGGCWIFGMPPSESYIVKGNDRKIAVKNSLVRDQDEATDVNLLNEGRVYNKIVRKYVSPSMKSLGRNQSKEIEIPKKEFDFLVKHEKSAYRSKTDKRLSFPPKSLETVKKEGDKIVLGKEQEKVFAGWKKNGDLLSSSTGFFDTYIKTFASDVKAIDDKIGAILFETHQWSDNGGGIGMSVFARAQYNGELYETKTLNYRDQWKQEKDQWSNYFTEITNAKESDGELYIQLKNGNGNTRWFSATKNK